MSGIDYGKNPDILTIKSCIECSLDYLKEAQSLLEGLEINGSIKHTIIPLRVRTDQAVGIIRHIDRKLRLMDSLEDE